MSSTAKIRTFQDLEAWQRAHALVLAVYELTRRYPDDEKFALTNQSRRAVVSVSSNISEGFGRTSQRDKYHFYAMAKTSLAELQNQLIIAHDLTYITDSEFSRVFATSDEAGALIKGLMRAVSA